MVDFIVRVYDEKSNEALIQYFSRPVLPREGEWLFFCGDEDMDFYKVVGVYHDLLDSSKPPLVDVDVAPVASEVFAELREQGGWTVEK